MSNQHQFNVDFIVISDWQLLCTICIVLHLLSIVVEIILGMFQDSKPTNHVLLLGEQTNNVD